MLIACHFDALYENSTVQKLSVNGYYTCCVDLLADIPWAISLSRLVSAGKNAITMTPHRGCLSSLRRPYYWYMRHYFNKMFARCHADMVRQRLRQSLTQCYVLKMTPHVQQALYFFAPFYFNFNFKTYILNLIAHEASLADEGLRQQLTQPLTRRVQKVSVSWTVQILRWISDTLHSAVQLA